MMKALILRNFIIIILCLSSNLYAQAENSEYSQNASIVVLLGSAVLSSAVLTAGDWLVTNIKTVHNRVNVSMRSLTEPKTTTISIPTEQLNKTPLKIGQKVKIDQMQTGYLFKTHGKTLGFLPNPEGKALLHSHRYA